MDDTFSVHHHHHDRHQGLDPLIRSVSKVTTAFSYVSSVFQFFSFLVVCSSMISKGFGFIAFFASVLSVLWKLLTSGGEFSCIINLLTPNDNSSGRTAPLTSKCCILYIYSTNIGTEYFKHGIYSPFLPLQNAVCFINLTYLVPVLFTFNIQNVPKLKIK